MIYNDIYPYLASKYNFSPENMIFPLNHLFQKAGKRYLMAGNRLAGHNFVTYDDIYPYPASKHGFSFPHSLLVLKHSPFGRNTLPDGWKWVSEGWKWVGRSYLSEC